jgi:hypothetical protein
MTLLAGQKIALPLMMLVFLRRWGGFPWRYSLAYGVAGWLVIVGFYDHVLGLTFYPSWLGLVLQGTIPGDWMRWLFI